MMNNIAVLRATRAGSKLMWRAAVAVILAGQVGILLKCLGIPYSPSITLISEVAAAPASGTCPAQKFTAFVEAFAESAAIQRRYTRIPLLFGQIDAALLGTPKEDEAFSTRIIHSFEAIPFFSRKDAGRIFPSKKVRMKEGVAIKVVAGEEHSGTDTIAAIMLPDTGFLLEYRFVTIDNCWSLVEIDNRSN